MRWRAGNKEACPFATSEPHPRPRLRPWSRALATSPYLRPCLRRPSHLGASPAPSPTALAPRPRRLASPTPLPTAPRSGPAPSPPRSLTHALAYRTAPTALAPRPRHLAWWRARMAVEVMTETAGAMSETAGPAANTRANTQRTPGRTPAPSTTAPRPRPTPLPPRLARTLVYGTSPWPRALATSKPQPRPRLRPWPRALATSPRPRPCLPRLALPPRPRHLRASPAPLLTAPTALAPRPRRLAMWRWQMAVEVMAETAGAMTETSGPTANRERAAACSLS
jgi:hypothetical protein